MSLINHTKKMFVENNKSGFAMLFAVLLSSVLVAIGISLFNISLKELTVATSARDSEIAYYAADSARECAVYWDIVKGAFPPLNADGSLNISSPSATITCNGNSKTFSFTCNSANPYTCFTIKISPFFNYSVGTPIDPVQPVADISISKTFDQSLGFVKTTLQTFGHNTGIIGRRTERGISFTYSQ